MKNTNLLYYTIHTAKKEGIQTTTLKRTPTPPHPRIHSHPQRLNTNACSTGTILNISVGWSGLRFIDAITRPSNPYVQNGPSRACICVSKLSTEIHAITTTISSHAQISV